MNTPKITELHYSKTNTYIIEGTKGRLLFDTGWAGTFPLLCRELGELRLTLQSIDCILISHFHPDHMGIAQDIANEGALILIPDVQAQYLHSCDDIFEKEKKTPFTPIDDDKVKRFPIINGRDILSDLGIEGQIIHTPGHSDDSISLCLDHGEVFAGDLNPLYELEMHKGTLTEDSWNRILSLRPKVIYYGHAKCAVMDAAVTEGPGKDGDLFRLISDIMKYTDKGYDIAKICKKTGSDKEFVEDVIRMYLTHRDVGVQGILDRIEIKNR